MNTTLFVNHPGLSGIATNNRHTRVSSSSKKKFKNTEQAFLTVFVTTNLNNKYRQCL